VISYESACDENDEARVTQKRPITIVSVTEGFILIRNEKKQPIDSQMLKLISLGVLSRKRTLGCSEDGLGGKDYRIVIFQRSEPLLAACEANPRDSRTTD
jgi:hypothetical protein